jgi:hypothetical protein
MRIHADSVRRYLKTGGAQLIECECVKKGKPILTA